MSISQKRIDKSLAVPLYFQLKTILLDTLRDALPGDMIEPESVMTKKYDVSRTTVRQAIAELVNEKYLYTVRGKGTFVADRKVDLAYMNKIESFADQVRKSGLTPSTKVLAKEVVPAGEEQAAGLDIEVGAEILYVKRLRFADDTPVAIAESYLPLPGCSMLLQADLARVSLYGELSRDPGTEVRHVHRTIGACMADAEEKELLQMNDSEILQYFINTAYNAEEIPVEYCVSKYRGDKNTFTVDLYV